jgi:hypothetical protein
MAKIPLLFVYPCLYYDSDRYHNFEKNIMDLTTNGAVITDAIKYVTQKQEQIDTLHKLDDRIEATGEEAEQEETTTTNGVF